MTPTLSQMLQDLRRQNSAWEVDQIALLPHAATPWGLYRQILREIDSRRQAIRDLAIAAEGHRRSAVFARLTLRPLRARGLALAARDAEEQARESAAVLEHLAARATAVRTMIPARLDPVTMHALEAEDGVARLALAELQAREQGALPPSEIRAAIDCLPAAAREAYAHLTGQGAASFQAGRLQWLLSFHRSPALVEARTAKPLELAW